MTSSRCWLFCLLVLTIFCLYGKKENNDL